MAAKKKVKKQNSSSTKTILPKPKLYPLSDKKPEEKKSIHHAAGIISEQESYHEGVYQKFPKEVIQSHIPQYNVVPYAILYLIYNILFFILLLLDWCVCLKTI